MAGPIFRPPHLGTRRFRLAACVCLLALLGSPAGCGSIMRQVRPQQFNALKIGRTTKQDVLATAGLPNERSIHKSEEDREHEVWVYHKGRGSFGLYTAVGAAPGPGSDMITIFLADIPISQRSKIAAVAVFDSSGILIDLKRPGDTATGEHEP